MNSTSPTQATDSHHQRGVWSRLQSWVWLVLLTAAIACTTSVQIGESVLAEPGPAGEIAYLSTSGDVVIVDPNGENRVRVTDDAGHVEENGAIFRTYDQPTWSRRSNQLAFVRIDRAAGGSGSAAVLVASSDGTPAEVVFAEEGVSPFYLYWSPTAELLTFLASRQQDPLLGLYLVDETGEAVLLDRGQPFYWAWSPLDSTIVQRLGGAGTRGRIGLRPDPEQEANDLDLRPAQFQAPAYAPDGRRIVVAADMQSGFRGLSLLNDQGELIQELAPTIFPVGFDWSADGAYLAYVERTGASPTDFGELKLIDMDAASEGSARETGVEGVAAFFWSPIGSDLLAIVPLLTQPGSDQTIAWGVQQPELRLRLVLVEASTGTARTLTEFEPTTQFLQMLPFYDQYQRSATIWSPDGEAIVYSALQRGEPPGIFVLPVEGEVEADFVGEGTLAYWSFR